MGTHKVQFWFERTTVNMNFPVAKPRVSSFNNATIAILRSTTIRVLSFRHWQLQSWRPNPSTLQCNPQMSMEEVIWPQTTTPRTSSNHQQMKYQQSFSTQATPAYAPASQEKTHLNPSSTHITVSSTAASSCSATMRSTILSATWRSGIRCQRKALWRIGTQLHSYGSMRSHHDSRASSRRIRGRMV